MEQFAVISLILALLSSGQNLQGPTLKETFDWMHSAFPESRTVTELLANETREFNFVRGEGTEPPSCTVTIVERWTRDSKPAIRDTVIDLSLIDPDSIGWYRDDTLEEGAGTLTMTTTNDEKVIVGKMENDEDAKPYFTNREFIYFIGPDYARRFANAFKRAVTLCGGKSSTF